MKTQAYTKTIAAIALALFVVCALYYGYSVYSLLTLKETLLEAQRDAALAQSEVIERNNLSRLLAESELERNELRSYVIEQKDIIDFLALVEALGRSQGASVSTVSLNVGSKENGYDELSVTIAASGSKEAVLHVLALLETLPYQSYVESATVSTRLDSESAQWGGTFRVVVTKHKELVE